MSGVIRDADFYVELATNGSVEVHGKYYAIGISLSYGLHGVTHASDSVIEIMKRIDRSKANADVLYTALAFAKIDSYLINTKHEVVSCLNTKKIKDES